MPNELNEAIDVIINFIDNSDLMKTSRKTLIAGIKRFIASQKIPSLDAAFEELKPDFNKISPGNKNNYDIAAIIKAKMNSIKNQISAPEEYYGNLDDNAFVHGDRKKVTDIMQEVNSQDTPSNDTAMLNYSIDKYNATLKELKNISHDPKIIANPVNRKQLLDLHSELYLAKINFNNDEYSVEHFMELESKFKEVWPKIKSISQTTDFQTEISRLFVQAQYCIDGMRNTLFKPDIQSTNSVEKNISEEMIKFSEALYALIDINNNETIKNRHHRERLQVLTHILVTKMAEFNKNPSDAAFLNFKKDCETLIEDTEEHLAPKEPFIWSNVIRPILNAMIRALNAIKGLLRIPSKHHTKLFTPAKSEAQIEWEKIKPEIEKLIKNDKNYSELTSKTKSDKPQGY